MEGLKKVLEEINILYREKKDIISKLQNEINKIEDELGDKKLLDTIKYTDYIKLKDDLQFLEKRINMEIHESHGIFSAREKVLDMIGSLENKNL